MAFEDEFFYSRLLQNASDKGKRASDAQKSEDEGQRRQHRSPLRKRCANLSYASDSD